MRVDGEQHCRVDYRYRWLDRQRERLGRVQRRREYRRLADWNPYDCR